MLLELIHPTNMSHRRITTYECVIKVFIIVGHVADVSKHHEKIKVTKCKHLICCWWTITNLKKNILVKLLNQVKQ